MRGRAPSAATAVGVVAVTALAATASSPWWPQRGRASHAVAQALAPWAGVAGLPLAVVAALTRRPRTAGGGLAVGAAGVAMRRWVAGAPAPTTLGPAGGDVRIGHFNVWFDNRDPVAAAATLAALDVDLLVISELTPRLTRLLVEKGVADAYPYRLDRPRRLAEGMAVWSRHPLVELDRDAISHERIRASVDVPGGPPILVDAVHTRSPIHYAAHWSADLTRLAADWSPDGPALMLGDFNAAWTHPGFRAIARRDWRDAHRALGVGGRNSWRIDLRWVRPFVRLDHALVNDDLDIVAVDDMDLPGSDHRGFVVTVRRR